MRAFGILVGIAFILLVFIIGDNFDEILKSIEKLGGCR